MNQSPMKSAQKLTNTVASENLLSNTSVTITSENQGETFSIAPAALLFIRSADNYAEVYFEESGQVSRKVVRNSLKNLEASLNLPTMLRCHKSYLVNTNRINHVSGNAQGYKLHFKGTDLLIPVSRQMNDEVKNLFTGGH
jgi:DNA-binding LytR/AlgR family response regulator